MNDNTGDKTISVTPKRTLGLKPRSGVERDTVRQSFSHGRTNTVQVERKKRRIGPADKDAGAAAPAVRTVEPAPARARQAARPQTSAPQPSAPSARSGLVLRQLS